MVNAISVVEAPKTSNIWLSTSNLEERKFFESEDKRYTLKQPKTIVSFIDVKGTKCQVHYPVTATPQRLTFLQDMHAASEMLAGLLIFLN